MPKKDKFIPSQYYLNKSTILELIATILPEYWEGDVRKVLDKIPNFYQEITDAWFQYEATGSIIVADNPETSQHLNLWEDQDTITEHWAEKIAKIFGVNPEDIEN